MWCLVRRQGRACATGAAASFTSAHDDEEETVARRLKVYEKQTAPLVNYYRQRNLLCEIDGVGAIDEIRARIIEALEI